MFGNKSRTTHHPDGTTITTTTHTTKTTAPHYSRSSGLMSRLRPRHKTRRPAHTHRTHGPSTGVTAVPARKSRFSRGTRGTPHSTTTAVAPRRKTSMGDKVSGAMMKLRGSLTRKPGLKAAGTRRMHGTDGRGTRRYY